MNNIEAATSYGTLTILLKPFLQDPRYLNESEINALADRLNDVLAFIQQITPPEVSQIRALLFGKCGQIQLNIQVVDGSICFAVKDAQEQLLLAMTIPPAVSLQLANTVLSHQAPPDSPRAKPN